MHFVQLLNSLDELLYGVMSWLVFYPLTLWRTMRRPLRMMEYADRELDDPEAEQYADTISPPMFLFLSIMLSHGIELALIGDSPIVANRQGLADLVDDDVSLLIMRLLAFSLFPLMMAVWMLRKQGTTLTRTTLKPPFYSQCYVTAPFALLAGIAATFSQCRFPGAQEAAIVLVSIAFSWYLAVQAGWFARQLHSPVSQGLGRAAMATLTSLAILLVMSLLIV